MRKAEKKKVGRWEGGKKEKWRMGRWGEGGEREIGCARIRAASFLVL
jgi:hypothetical protein